MQEQNDVEKPKPIYFRPNEEDQQRIDQLSQKLNEFAVKPLSNQDVIKYALKMLHERMK